jgi:ABC-type bacteriocin/lantibiotic exporter with double-glycine peptidase domain
VSLASKSAPAVPDLGGAPVQNTQDWVGSTPVKQQSTDTNCGATVANMLADAAGKGGTEEANPDALNARFASAAGTTSLQLSNMLAHEGLGVKQAYGSVQQQWVDEALGKGQKIAAQVDSNRILPGSTNATPAGKSHWVVVDGKDDQGNYSVKDPGTGKSYSVSLDQLTEAVRAGWDKHNAGGVLVVEDVKGQESEAQLAQEGANHASALGNGPGVGSNAYATYGRESS